MIRLFDGKRVQISYTINQEIIRLNLDQHFGKDTSSWGRTKSEVLMKYNIESCEDRATFIHSRNIFSEVRDYINNSVYDKATSIRFPVNNEAGELSYYIEYEYSNEYMEFEHYDVEGDRYDLSLLSSRDVLMFSTLNEYSYACYELLNRVCDKQIYFLDKRICLFDESLYMDSTQAILFANNNIDKNILYVYDDAKDLRYLKDDCLYRKIGIISLFKGIYWPQAYLNNSNTISIKESRMKLGLINAARVLDGLCYFAKKNGLDIVLGEDTFALYPATLMKELFTIQGYEIGTVPCDATVFPVEEFFWDGIPQLRENMFRVDAMLEELVSCKIKEQIEEKKSMLFGENKKILGFVARGTDYIASKPQNHSVQLDIKNAISLIDDLLEENHYEKIFIATEDLDILEVCKSHFKDNLIFVDQVRISKKDIHKNELLGDILSEMSYQEKAKYAQDYLLAIYCGSCCQSLVATGSSAASEMMQKLKNQRKERYNEIILPELGVW